MIKDRERAPESNDSEKPEEVNGVDLEKEGSGGEKVLREILKEVPSEGEEYHESSLESSQRAGAGEYMAIWAAECANPLKPRVIENIDKEVNEAKEYLREKFDWRDDNTLYPFEGGVMAVLNSSQGTHFQFGHRSVALEGSPSREAYMKTLCQIKEHINDDSRWSKGAEEAQIRRTDRASALKHLEGFGIAALDHDDIETAVDAFIEGDLIKNKEIAEEVAGKIKKLVQSEKPEDRAKAIAAKESLEKFFKEDEGNKQEIFLNALDEYLDAMEQLGTISPEQAEEKRKAARLIVTSFSDDPAHDAQIFADSGIVGEKEMIKSLENKRDATE